jgi:hypothetical protein
MIPELNTSPVSDLLRLYSVVLEELRRRGITRTSNNPVADYTEHVVARSLNLSLVDNSVSGYDATDSKGRRYQIKGRRLTRQNSSTELSALRNLSKRPFDFLVAVVYRADFSIDYAGIVPYDVVVELSKYTKHTNAHRFLMRRSVLDDPRVTDLTHGIVVQ